MLHIQISLSKKFQLGITISIFEPNLHKKGYFQSQTEKVNITIELCIFKSALVRTFSLKLQLPVVGPTSPKKEISSLKQKK